LIIIVTSFYFNEKVGAALFFLPFVIYAIYALSIQLEKKRKNRNVFYFYLIKLPHNFIFVMLYASVVALWYFLPAYYIQNSMFYRVLLGLLSGEIGKLIWLVLYGVMMTYVGSKLLKKFRSIANPPKTNCRDSH
jgi:hypothetical protein